MPRLLGRTAKVFVIGPLLIMIGACGSGGKSEKSAPTTSASTSAVSASADAQWAVDACKTFAADAAAKASGIAVASASLASHSSGGPATLSDCNYTSADSKDRFAVMLRQDTTGDTTVAEQIAGLGSAVDMTGPMEGVLMPRGKALWAPKLRTLSYVPDDARMIVVTPPGLRIMGKSDPDAVMKQRAIAIAQAVPL